MIASSLPAEFAKAALSFVGTPFRLQGRDPLTGLDCAGLVSASLRKIGQPHKLPEGYTLRNLHPEAFIPFIEQAGFIESSREREAGDLLLTKPGPGQLHLLIASAPANFVHAHAGLRRVVETPGQPDWPLLGSWQLKQD